ncbi:unnamed protein product [Gadus morhua 'NCC']
MAPTCEPLEPLLWSHSEWGNICGNTEREAKGSQELPLPRCDGDAPDSTSQRRQTAHDVEAMLSSGLEEQGRGRVQSRDHSGGVCRRPALRTACKVPAGLCGAALAPGSAKTGYREVKWEARLSSGSACYHAIRS